MTDIKIDEKDNWLEDAKLEAAATKTNRLTEAGVANRLKLQCALLSSVVKFFQRQDQRQPLMRL